MSALRGGAVGTASRCPLHAGASEVINCNCPSPHSALGRRKAAIEERQAARVKVGKRADWNRPVSTPAMAHKAAEGLVRGLSPTAAFREAGFPPSTVRASRRGLNRMIRAPNSGSCDASTSGWGTS